MSRRRTRSGLNQGKAIRSQESKPTSFSKIHLSDLFQRRQRSWVGNLAESDHESSDAFSAQNRPEHREGRRRSSSTFSSIFSPRGKADLSTQNLNPGLLETFHHQEHIDAFRRALEDDEGQREPSASSSILSSLGGTVGRLGVPSAKSLSVDQNGDSTSHLISDAPVATITEPTMTAAKHPKKVGRIAAASDFAPVHERTKVRRRGNAVDTGGREGTLYLLLRFPLLVCVFVVIALEFAAYVIIRQIVNVVEYFVAWRGYKGTLRSRLRKASTAKQWKEIAIELDAHLGYESWKQQDASGLYDWILIKKVLQSLQEMRREDDAEGVMSVLDLCLRNNFAGTENFRLYSETFFGTKYVIEKYLTEVEEALNYVAKTDKIAPSTKKTFYRNVSKNMGRSALCLSGGGCFGYYHVGVLRALLDANLLPNIITGTSAGGLIAALACTRTNDELDGLLVPELADRITACEEPFSTWGKRLYKTGARFDTVKWAEKAQFFTMGSMTFAEAFARTGKVLNISVIPSDRHSPVKLLNYYTAPNCIIWSSLLASAAVPGILNPVCLMQKSKSGEAIPWNWGHRFKDGSLRVDIPLQDLHSLFNVNYPIVSQVNPHVHLFFFAPKGMPGRPVAHRRGKGWRGGFVLSASEHVLKLNLSMNFKIIRDLDLLPSILGQDWSSVFLQRFSGAVTIWPKTRAWDWVRILSDPDRKELARMMQVGSSVTFPKLHMIENRVRLERAIQEGRTSNRRHLRALQQKGHLPEGLSSNQDQNALTSAPSAGALTQSDTDLTGDDFVGKEDNLGLYKPIRLSRARGKMIDYEHTRPLPRQFLSKLTLQTDTPTSENMASFEGEETPLGLKDVEERLPRHIRERSMGIDDADTAGSADEDGDRYQSFEFASAGRQSSGHRPGMADWTLRSSQRNESSARREAESWPKNEQEQDSSSSNTTSEESL